MKRLLPLFGTAALAALVALPFTATAQNEIDSVCMITNEAGRINDGTFNTTSYEGLTRAADEFGLESTYIETVAAADYESNFATCIDEGYDIIVTIGFLITDATRTAAEANPDVFFIGVDQFFVEPLPNLVGLQFREDEAGFLVGAMAALVTESDSVGGVYGIPIPPVVKFRTGFENGVAYIDPDVTVSGVYIDDFMAPDRGAAAAEQLIGEGADVLIGAGGPTGSGAITFAASQDVYVIGVDVDEYLTTFGGGETAGAENLITSAIKRVDNGVYAMIEAVVNGEAFPASSIYVLNVANGGIGFAPPNDSDVSPEITAQIEDILAGLQSGSIVTGANPITGEPLPNLGEIVATAVAGDPAEFTILAAALEAAGLTETITTGGPFTVFAPTDAAFEAALTELGITAEALLADTDLLTDILLYHVVPGGLTSSLIVGMGGGDVTTVQGETLSVEVTDMGVVINGTVNVIAVDTLAANGVVHVIDGVLLPPGE